MTSLLLFAILSSLCVLGLADECTETSWDSFSKEGFTTCSRNNQYIQGFHRDSVTYYMHWFKRKEKDPISNLKTAKCCRNTDKAYYINENAICQSGDWVKDFDKPGWALCPTGHFLQGLYRSKKGNLYNIEYGRCCRPWGHPLKYEHCFEQSLDHSKSTIGCKKPNYYVVGMKRSGSNLLKGLEKFKCCKLMPKRPPPTSFNDVKQYIMDKTRLDLVWLADYLGYAWCRGCRSLFVGDDFRRVGDSWEAGTRGWFCGNNNDKRLKIHFKNWKFLTYGNAVWGKHVRQVMPAQEVDSGKVTNNEAEPTKTIIDKVEESTRTVTHVVSKTWKKSHEFGVDLGGFLLGFAPFVAGGVGGRLSYKFKYEDSTTTTDSNQRSDVKKFKIHSEKTIPGYSEARWRILMTKTRTTIPYTVRVLAHFPVEFDGLLRSHTNFHEEFRDKNQRPHIKYTIGNDRMPFFQSLKEDISKNMYPWNWDKMQQKNKEVESIIARLVDKNTYLFTVSGQIEDIVGKRVEIQWNTGNAPWPQKRGNDPDALPRIYPPAPEIRLPLVGEPITENVEELE